MMIKSMTRRVFVLLRLLHARLLDGATRSCTFTGYWLLSIKNGALMCERQKRQEDENVNSATKKEESHR
jgi:hypothetical protein